MKEKDLKPGLALSIRVGEFVENSIEKTIVSKKEAPVLQGAPDKNIWYKYPIPEGITVRQFMRFSVRRRSRLE